MSLADLLAEAMRRPGVTVPPSLSPRRRDSGEIVVPDRPPLIAPGATFRSWCEDLGRAGMMVDGHPFSLANRPAMWEVFDQIPNTIEDAYGRTVVVQKGAQVGATVLEQLAALWFAIRFAPCQCLMYLPDRSMASYKSTNRFMPIARSIPRLHQLLTDGKAREGNVLTRVVRSLGSGFLFLWTHGREGGVTESFPGDFLSLDEVQGITLEQVDRVTERLSASRIRFRLLLSTPLWPELDINAFFLAGDQRQFHSCCECEDGVALTPLFVESALRGRSDFPVKVLDGEWAYFCPTCGAVIEDTQRGRWVPHRPDGAYPSFHLSQVLSPTISPREILEAWGRADTVARRQNFFCRKLGTPFADASQVLATLDILRRCVDPALAWRESGKGCLMGVDQMGSFAVVTVVDRRPDGRMAVAHVELVYDLDPWARLDALLVQFGVTVCVVEQLPSIDSARQFAHRHPGVVWLITSYGDLEEFVVWGDVTVSKSDRKTAEDYRDRWTLRADRFRVLDWAAARLREGYICFPDPAGLIGEIRDQGAIKHGPVLSEVFWLHYSKTGLVLQDPEQAPTDKSVRAAKRLVLKLGLDPHASFSLLAVCLAWFRAYGTTHFLLPGVSDAADRTERVHRDLDRTLPGLPSAVAAQLLEQTVVDPGTCGACSAFQDGFCQARGFNVKPSDPGCPDFLPG